MNFTAPCIFGLESLVSDELKKMGAENVAAENGRVFFSGDEYLAARANIRSRFSERIMIVVGSFEAHSFEELFEGTKALPWENFIGEFDEFPVKGHSVNSDLFSISDCQSIIKKAIVERLKTKYNVQWFEETGVKFQIDFSIMKNKVHLMIDTTGMGLHKRGYRPVANEAPIKETLAAAMCALSHLRPYHTLYDPMCGSGTILIEGAMLVHNIAPGLKRHFASERFPFIPYEIWESEREKAESEIITESDFKAYGFDINRQTLETAKDNAIRAGVADKIEFARADIRDFAPKSEKGTVITNPPYGERIEEKKNLPALYKTIGERFKALDSWSMYLITAYEDAERYIGRKADKNRKIYNGMMKTYYYQFMGPKPPRRKTGDQVEA